VRSPIADRTTGDEKMRAFRRLAYEREIELATRLRDGWFALRGRFYIRSRNRTKGDDDMTTLGATRRNPSQMKREQLGTAIAELDQGLRSGCSVWRGFAALV
jgi:hypothetical protein